MDQLSNEKENINIQDCGYEYCQEETDTVLIDLVKNFPYLYDKSAADFKNVKKKERTWMEISTILRLPVSDCQNRWQRLREKFSREKKRREQESRSGSAACTRTRFSLHDNMNFLDSVVKSRKTYTNIIPQGTHFISNMSKNTNILQRNKAVKIINNVLATSSEVLKPLSSPLSIPSSSSISLSSSLSPLPTSNEISLLMQPCIKSTPENTNILQRNKTVNNSDILSEKLKSSSPLSISSSSSVSASSPLLSSASNIKEVVYTSEVQQCIQSTPEKKKSKCKSTKIQEADVVEKSFLNLSSIVSQHFLDKKRVDEDDVFESTVACQLRKTDEPRKTELKGKIMKILYEL